MAKPRSPRVALVIKRTSYRKLVVEEHDPLVKKLLRRHDPTVVRLESSHLAHEAAVLEVEETLRELGANIVYRGSPRGKMPKRLDLVITVGGDGTLLATSHQLGRGVPLLGINSAPESSVGFFCGGANGTAAKTIERALHGTLPGTELARMRVEKNGKVIHARVLNEALFCASSPAATSRYILRVEKEDGSFAEEDQRSSGMWIGPAAGSTAAQRSAGGKVLPLQSKRIQYVVREPYTPAGGRFRLALGLLDPGGRLVIRNKMREAKVFLDGHRIVHDVSMGDVLVMRRSEETLTVLGIATKRRV